MRILIFKSVGTLLLEVSRFATYLVRLVRNSTVGAVLEKSFNEWGHFIHHDNIKRIEMHISQKTSFPFYLITISTFLEHFVYDSLWNYLVVHKRMNQTDLKRTELTWLWYSKYRFAFVIGIGIILLFLIYIR